MRALAGQAVIQFAKDKQTHEEFAIKVFLSRRAFEDEARLYEADSCPLGHFLPQVRDIVPNRDAQLVDAAGSPLPPCIVMEKGESLDVWMLRSADMGIDMVTGLQVRPGLPLVRWGPLVFVLRMIPMSRFCPSMDSIERLEKRLGI